VARFDLDNNPGGAGLTPGALREVDLAIEFSTPETVLDNLRRLIPGGIPVVTGTTGWYDHLPEVRQLVTTHGGALVYSPNFSIGVNLFFEVVRQAAQLVATYDHFDPFLIERHHRQKLDAPSGTALRLLEDLREAFAERMPEAVSVRAGYLPGTHEVGFDSPTETITLTHTARNREGFAEGAVLAGEKLLGRQGFFALAELLFPVAPIPPTKEVA
ncbi:MAG: 4-hydroxy-tetrahydrodipicolinate reductase, partial [Blastocatellia bacterium]